MGAKACEMWGKELKDDVINSGATVVIRPDSGDPVVVVPKMLRILAEHFGFSVNEKGYKVLNNVRVIWGDGINSVSLSSILRTVVDVAGWSADNIAFGMGGGLLQQLDRDTLKFAMKCSSVGIREWIHDAEGLLENKVVWRDVFKDPATDPGKASKKGRVQLWTSGGEYETSVERPTRWTDKGVFWQHAMVTYFIDGSPLFSQSFDEVRANSML